MIRVEQRVLQLRHPGSSSDHLRANKSTHPASAASLVLGCASRSPGPAHSIRSRTRPLCRSCSSSIRFQPSPRTQDVAACKYASSHSDLLLQRTGLLARTTESEWLRTQWTTYLPVVRVQTNVDGVIYFQTSRFRLRCAKCAGQPQKRTMRLQRALIPAGCLAARSAPWSRPSYMLQLIQSAFSAILRIFWSTIRLLLGRGTVREADITAQIHGISEDPVALGAFADIYTGVYENKKVGITSSTDD